MDLRLYEAARTGNTSSLRALLEEDPLILERGSLNSIAETCLHIAALAASVNFVREIMSFKPELAKRVNRDGFTPIHMASANGYADIVKELLMRNKELSRQKSADGRTALHFAAITGSVDVLRVLTNTCPECKADLTDRDESALHIALKNNQVEAFEMLWGMLKEINTEEINSLVNAKDQDGNTILHIAVARKQYRVVKLLLDLEGVSSIMFKVEVNSNNKGCYTALDMLFHSRRTVDDPLDHVICEMLQQAGALRNQDTIVALTSTVATHQDDQQTNQVGENSAASHQLPVNNPADRYLRMPWKFIAKEVSSLSVWKIRSTLTQEIENSTPEMRNALMVVAVLIATVTYQSVLSPPGGYRQFDVHDDPDLVHSDGIAIISSDAVMFSFAIFFSSVGFSLSIVIILMLVSKFPLKWLLQLAVLAVSADFVCTILYIAPIEFSIIYKVTMVMVVLVVIFFLYFISLFLSRWRQARRRMLNV